MELRLLRSFVAVAREGSFTKAAEKLNIAQPPLSRQVQQLEAEVGALLIDRSVRPFALTPAGQLMLNQAQQVLERVEELQSAMRRFVTAGRKRYVLGFVPSTIYGRLPDLIRGFRAAVPDVDLALAEMMSQEQVEALKEGRIDIGFGRIRLEDPAIRRVILFEEPLVVALPLSHPLAAEGDAPVSLQSLVRQPLIIYPRHPRPSYADQVLAVYRDHGLNPAEVVEARELQTAIGLVAAEAGLCIVPASVSKSRREDVCYRPIAEPNATSPIILSHRASDQSPELAALLDLIAAMPDGWGDPRLPARAF